MVYQQATLKLAALRMPLLVTEIHAFLGKAKSEFSNPPVGEASARGAPSRLMGGKEVS